MAKQYDLRDYAMSRLEGTIVRYRNKALYVGGIDEDVNLVGHHILGEERFVIDQEDPELDMSSPRVGYVNTREAAHFFMRQPMRRWKQGVDPRCLVSPRAGMRARGNLDLQSLARCIEGDYPSFEKALGMFSSRNPFRDIERQSVAFSRDFSAQRGRDGLVLAYKDREVGVIERGTPVLSTDYHWLTETLEGVLG